MHVLFSMFDDEHDVMNQSLDGHAISELLSICKQLILCDNELQHVAYE